MFSVTPDLNDDKINEKHCFLKVPKHYKLHFDLRVSANLILMKYFLFRFYSLLSSISLAPLPLLSVYPSDVYIFFYVYQA